MGLVLGSLLLELLILLASLLAYAYHGMRTKYNSFLERGLISVTPLSQWKHDMVLFMGRRHVSEHYSTRYAMFKKAGLGVVSISPLAIYVTDPDLINSIFIKDFSHFHDRPFSADVETNPLEGHLFLLKGEKWRALRNKLSPTFTSGKLKGMYPLMEECGELLMKGIEAKALIGDIEVMDLLGCFTTDVIGSCAFGYEPTTMQDPDSDLRRFGKRVFHPTVKEFFLRIFRFIVPGLFRSLKIRTIPKEVNDFFFSVVRQTFDERLRTGVKRQDFLQLLLQLREKGHVDIDPREEDEDEESTSSSSAPTESIELTDELLTAQAFVFLVAGFETSATTMSYTLYELAKNPDSQERLRQEIRDSKRKHGSISYQALKEMTYLECCINESLRLHPPISVLFRMCTKDYVTSTGHEIKKGTRIVLPVIAIQRDPDHFPEPDLFRPERFKESTPAPGTFLPFGDGPRICIGQRFALLEVKMGLAKILDQYDVTKCSRTEERCSVNPSAIILEPKNGIWLKFNKIKQ